MPGHQPIFILTKYTVNMAWFKRSDKGILTPTEAKREVPDGLWFKSPAGKIVHTRELKNNAYPKRIK